MRQKPARILYVNPMSLISGAELALMDLMANLNPDKYQPIFLCASPGPFTRLCEEHNIQTLYIPSLPPNSGKASYSLRMLVPNAVRIARIVKKERINLIHSNSPRVGYHGGFGARLSGVPSVIHARDYYKTPFRSLVKSYFLRALSDRLIAISQATYAEITARLPALRSMTRVIYDGISPLPDYSRNTITCFRNELGMGNNRPLLAVVGSISELKAQIIAVQAMPEILSKFPDARLLIVGEANDRLGELYKQKLISSIEGLGLQNYVTLTGFRNDIPLLMSSIDLLVHVPVLPEALGRVILEASLQGALVIGSDIGGIKEIINDGETGRLVQPGNPSQVAGSVIDLLSSPVKAEQMRRASVIRVKQKFNCDTYVNQIQSVYEELL